jgi:hypothetical protein
VGETQGETLLPDLNSAASVQAGRALRILMHWQIYNRTPEKMAC